MRWGDGRESDNVEDRRGMPVGLAGGGIGAVVIVLIAMFFGVDPRALLQQVQQSAPTQQSVQQPAGQEDPMKKFVSVVLADTEDTWRALFQAAGRQYVDPKLVLFTGAVQSACGFAQAAVGPFYCPGDQKVYIDLAFYRELRERFHAPGDFAQAYVIAHEVGHHVQNLLGISDKVHAAQSHGPDSRANALSVRLELQADCLAGVWAYHADRARHILEQGDVEQALNAAAQIGDDRMQMRARGYVSPESFTHGSSEQRVHWFKTGMDTGSVKACNTFGSGQV
ncbi:MAG: flagellar biosynthesis protein FlgM [Proteobacteria bacterium]|nr:MAG: flagellar biosynthesis protein FlgM [Pseudomonadota bacterium]